VSFDCDTGPRDIIRHDVDGFLVAPDDTKAMEAALDKLMADEQLRENFALRAIEARDRFSMRKISSMWEDVFRPIETPAGSADRAAPGAGHAASKAPN
jgi:glycosyltransferase involved in cell wall biosynthesis